MRLQRGLRGLRELERIGDIRSAPAVPTACNPVQAGHRSR